MLALTFPEKTGTCALHAYAAYGSEGARITRHHSPPLPESERTEQLPEKVWYFRVTPAHAYLRSSSLTPVRLSRAPKGNPCPYGGWIVGMILRGQVKLGVNPTPTEAGSGAWFASVGLAHRFALTLRRTVIHSTRTNRHSHSPLDVRSCSPAHSPPEVRSRTRASGHKKAPMPEHGGKP